MLQRFRSLPLNQRIVGSVRTVSLCSHKAPAFRESVNRRLVSVFHNLSTRTHFSFLEMGSSHDASYSAWLACCSIPAPLHYLKNHEP